MTNADGTISIVTIMRVQHIHHFPLLALGLLAVIFIASGLYLLLRKEKSTISKPRM